MSVTADSDVGRYEIVDGAGDSGHYLRFKCPCGTCRDVDMIPLNKEHGWKWDGNRERPSLEPSLQKNTLCKWHGFLVRGRWCLDQGGQNPVPNAWSPP